MACLDLAQAIAFKWYFRHFLLMACQGMRSVWQPFGSKLVANRAEFGSKLAEFKRVGVWCSIPGVWSPVSATCNQTVR